MCRLIFALAYVSVFVTVVQCYDEKELAGVSNKGKVRVGQL